MPEIQFGWKKDLRDERDYYHPTVKVTLLPQDIDLSRFLPPVRSQGLIGSCTGHGIGANITGTYRQKLGDPEWESPTWIYNLGRMKQGWLASDTGAYPRDCLDQLLEYGLLKERHWPYDGSRLDATVPSQERKTAALKWADFAYYRCVDGVDGICSALAAGHLVSIGSPWFEKWIQIVGQAALPEVSETDKTLGGHETCLYGYDRERQIFYGMNSWGADWGDKGFFTMPFSAIDVFKKLWGYDAHYVTFTPAIVPQPAPPEPSPVPSPCRWGNAVAATANAIFLQELRGRKGRFAYMNFPDK